MNQIRTYLADGTFISTVRINEFAATLDLVLDPMLGRETQPYETMVFNPDEFPQDCRCVRYATEAEARAGHNIVVQEESRQRGVEVAPGDVNLPEDEDDAAPLPN
jgi:hypothetical protein